jgi:hypothetical protein
MTPRPGSVAIATAVTARFVSYARVLARSLRAAAPGIPVFAAACERTTTLQGWDEPDFALLPIEQFGRDDLTRQAFVSTPHELTVLAKPLVLRHLLQRGFDTVLFLDADVLVLDDLSPVIATCAAHAVTLSPHLLDPPAGGDRVARELTIARSGTFNGGFVGVSARPDAARFLDWWLARVATHNRMDPAAGFHHDQRWLDLAPGFVDVGIVRDPGWNVAYWNLAERGLEMTGDRPRVAGGPCRMFHFSGFDPARPDPISRHSTWVTRESLGPAWALVDRYAEALEAAGWPSTSTAPYSYEAFDDGVAIPPLARILYRDLGDTAARFGDPFRADAPGGFRAWLGAPDDSPGPGGGLPRLWSAVYRSRPDLQQAFPAPTGADGGRFRQWARACGVAEHAIDVRLAP